MGWLFGAPLSLHSLYFLDSDEDLAKYTQHRNDMDALVGEWKRSELLREASEAEVVSLREQLRFVLAALMF